MQKVWLHFYASEWQLGDNGAAEMMVDNANSNMVNRYYIPVMAFDTQKPRMVNNLAGVIDNNTVNVVSFMLHQHC
jgi:hypothetical protein